MTNHRVAQGECAGSIAARYGVAWRTIWEHPDNAGLRERTRDPSALHPGDVLFVPAPEPRWEAGSTGATHRFALAPARAEVRLRLIDGGEPVAGAAYRFKVTGSEEPVREGSTDGEGRLVERVAVDAREAVVELPGRGRVYRLKLGHLDPVGEVSGAQARLKQLGFYDGAVDGRPSDELALALWGFQLRHGLAATGELDAATQDALRREYGM